MRRRLRDLEIENQKLQEMLAEAELDKWILKEALKGNYCVRLFSFLPSAPLRMTLAFRVCKHTRYVTGVSLDAREGSRKTWRTCLANCGNRSM